jgi:hypothetical protein
MANVQPDRFVLDTSEGKIEVDVGTSGSGEVGVRESGTANRGPRVDESAPLAPTRESDWPGPILVFDILRLAPRTYAS